MNREFLVKADLEKEVRRRRLQEAVAMQEIEGNPLSAEDIAMFEMFERKNMSPEQIRAYIIEQARARISRPAE